MKVLKGTLLAAGVVFGGVFLAGAGVAFAGTAGFWTVANAIAINAFLGGISAQLAGSRKGPRIVETVEYFGTVEPRRIIYGQRLVSGMNALEPLTSGTNNKYLHQILVLAGHECNAFSAVYFNGEAVGTLTAISGTANDGKVTTGTFANKAWVRGYLGTSSQTADYILDTAFSSWTSDHDGVGIAYVALQYELDQEVYKNGKPEVTVLVQGKKCYDPDADSSPGADPTNASYASYTTNPARCLADFLINELGEDPASIDWDMMTDAMDICDESVTVPTDSTHAPSGSQSRYTCNLVMYSSDTYEDSITAICDTMLGSCIFSGGKWRMRAGAWESSSFEITDSNVMGALEHIGTYPFKERWNGVRGTYIAAYRQDQEDEFPVVQDATYVSDDGEELFRDVRFAGCTNVYEAIRAAIIQTRKSRNGEFVTIPCDMSLCKVRPGDTGIVTITDLGWSSQQVRCESWGFTADGAVALTVRVENSADWDDPDTGDYITPTAITAPTPVYFTPAAPSSLTTKGTPRAITLTWTPPALVPAGAQAVIYEYTSSTPFASASEVWRGKGTTATISKSDTTTRYYWVLYEMPDGTDGTEYPTSTAGVAGAAQPSYEIGTNTDAGPITKTTSGMVLQASTITVEADEIAEITITCRVSITPNNPSTDRLYICAALDSGSTIVGQPLYVFDGPAGVDMTGQSVTFVATFGPAGLFAGSYDIGLYSAINSGTPSIDYEDISIRVTVLKL